MLETDWHIPEELCGRFLRAEVSKSESRQIVRHLVSGCPQCVELAHRATVELGLCPTGAPAWEKAYEESFRRALAFATEEEKRVALEKLQGWGQWAALEPLAPEARFTLIETETSYRTLGLYDRLLEASRLYMRREPAEAVDIVRLAIHVAERLDPERHGRQQLADLRATAWADLGNVKRLASDFEGARQAFNEAWRILEEEGTNDSLKQAHIIGLEASYMNDLGEFETAEVALEEALEIYQKAGDVHFQGRTLLKMGDAIGHIDPERGLTHVRKALSLIDAGKEPRLDLCAQHDCAWYLNDCRRPEEALAVLEQARPLYKQFPDAYTQFRLHWLEGKIAASLGNFEEAEDTFGQLWDEFRARDLNHELVILSIDLAEVLVKKGELDRAAQLTEECYPILKAWGLHKDALSAWLVFQQALTHGRAGEIFRRARAYYRRHWVLPGRFEA